MGRKFVDCREFPSDVHCTLVLAADTEEELMEAAVLHVVTVHRHPDTPQLRDELRQAFHDGVPPS